MKLGFCRVGIVGAAVALAVSVSLAQAPGTVKVLGCLQGDGTEQKPWFISGVALPAPAPPPAAAAPAGGRGGVAGGGVAAGPGAVVAAVGAAAGPGAGPAAAGAAGAPAAGAPGGAAGGQGGRGGGGRGGGGRGGGAATAPVVPAAPVPLVDLRLGGGMNMSVWRGMKIEVEGTLGPKPSSGLQEIHITSARSVQGICTPK